jgi:hypothetical protein
MIPFGRALKGWKRIYLYQILEIKKGITQY